MADQIFNIAKGRWGQFYINVEDNIVAAAELNIMLLKVAEADATLIDYDTFAAILAGSNTEADFTNYARKQLDDTNLDPVPAPDDTNNRYDFDLGDQTWLSAGGATNNTLVKLILGYDPLGTNVNANIIPIAHYDFSVTTNGGDITAVVNAAGFARAA